MLYTEVKYLKLISYRLERFKIKKDNGNSFLANCRCPICGDSEQSAKKTRGYFYNRGTKLLFKCHNCNASLGFVRWLKDFDFNIYSMLKLEEFQNNPTYQQVAELPDADEKTPDLRTKPYVPSILTGIKSIVELNDDHPVRKYVEGRKIPEEFWSELYYAPKFFKWTTGHTDKFERVVKEFPEQEHPRLIIPFFSADTKEAFMYHARSFGKEVPKYYSIKLNKKPPPFYGMDRMDKTKRVYILEGPLDSLFLPNSVAIGSSSLHMFDLDIEKTYVVDNENRNREILKEYDKLIKMGYDVCIWPDTYEYKDINEAVMAGLSIFDIKAIIDDNTYHGLKAEVRFKQWRKVSNDDI